MIGKTLLFKVAALPAITALALTFTPATIYAAGNTMNQQPTTEQQASAWQPAPAKPDMSSIVFTNYDGGGEAILIDLGGQMYTVPAATATGPGRLQIDVAPGATPFTASLPGFGSANRAIDLKTGQIEGVDLYSIFKLDHTHDKLANGKRTKDKFDYLAVTFENLTPNQATMAMN